MAAPKRGRSASAQSKPGRSLALILIAIVALTGGMFASGNTTPRLGIDLAGGTSITLQAENEPGQPNAINKTNMNTAVAIMNRRVNGLGVSETEVQTQGTSNIIVNIPRGTNSEEARQQVGTTAKLYFRPVLATEASGAAATTSPSPSASSSSSAKSTDKPKATSSSSASPSATATSQGRAVTDALKADSTPSATATSSAKASASPSPSASGSSAASDAAAKLQAQYAALDCTKKTAQTTAGKNAKATEPTVGCGKISGVWYKYVLGPARVDGTDVKKAQAVFDTQTAAGWQVQMTFTGSGAKKFADVTAELAKNSQPPQNEFGIVLDGEVVSSPTVAQSITGGQAEISGSFTQTEAQSLANVLSYGALPLSFRTESVTTVTAALGGQQLHAGLLAGAIGLALVVIYLVAFYRGLSLIAIPSLLVSGILTYVIMSLLGPAIHFALNLPAVCGAIVAIGITADSFIVFFERIRDEIREGRTLRPAVERAWPRARRTILVSDFVSFLAAAVLFIVTVGKVQGFAFTLGLTTVLDVVVVFLFTKPLMTLVARRKFFASGHKWSGLDPKGLGAKAPLRRTRRPAGPVAGPVDPKEA
ncbi:protein translocase subunit SecD [Streptomyces sasae]|uniref:protein translocase subunit SecD n=1 Tax=Streptomyces sasae TaxID=1266772 RepID=UPI00292DAFB0|nr:protein translocase subunit SecD [Streptomyces sasae]